MKKIVLVALLLSVGLCWAQQENTVIELATSKLISKLETFGITNYFVADRSCDGQTITYRMPDKRYCTPEGTAVVRYLFWKQNGVTMIKQIDACGAFTSVGLKHASLFDFYIENREDFVVNKVKPYAIAGQEDKARLKVGEDNCRRDFMFKSKDGAFTQHHNIFYLTNAMKKQNVNFEYNKGLSIVALDKMIDEAIMTMASNGLWKRI